MKTRLSLLMICTQALAGCGSLQDYRVLLPRPAERANAQQPPETRPVPPLPALPASPALAQHLSALANQARQGDEAFQAQQSKLMPQLDALHTSTPSSEAWIAGQEALSALETTRGPSMTALGELDRLYSDARLNNTGGVAEIDVTRARVKASVDAEDAFLTALKQRASRPNNVPH